MSMKKIIKRILSFVLACMLLSLPIYAEDDDLPTMSGVAPKEVQNVATHVLGYIQLAGYAMAVGMLLYLGIKYMMAPANEKADLKSSSIKYVIGAVVIGGATGLLGLLQGFASKITVSNT